MHDRASLLVPGLVTLDAQLEEEFEARLVETSKLAFRVAFSVLRHKHDAEDVAQESFAKAYRHFTSLRDRFRAWLVRHRKGRSSWPRWKCHYWFRSRRSSWIALKLENVNENAVPAVVASRRLVCCLWGVHRGSPTSAAGAWTGAGACSRRLCAATSPTAGGDEPRIAWSAGAIGHSGRGQPLSGRQARKQPAL